MEQLKTTIVNYGGGIYAIDQQMVRAFLLVGEDAALLLDTGAIRIDIKSYINEITSLPLMVVLTHGDPDHIGNLQDFSQAYICELDMPAVRAHTDCAEVELLPLSEGQVFDIGARKLRVFFAPGHTAGSVCLIDDENKILFAGDAISRGPVFMFGERRDIGAYLKTLRAIKKMKDSGAFDAVYCCHNVCPAPAGTTEALISCVEGILDKSIEGVPAQMPIPIKDKPLIARFGDCAVLF